LNSFYSRFSTRETLKNVSEVISSKQKSARKWSLYDVINEHFERNFQRRNSNTDGFSGAMAAFYPFGFRLSQRFFCPTGSHRVA